MNTTSSLGTTLLILNCILLAMPLGLINLGLTASRCAHRGVFVIHATILAIALLTGVTLMTFDLPSRMAEALARHLPLLLLIQTIVLYFSRRTAGEPSGS